MGEYRRSSDLKKMKLFFISAVLAAVSSYNLRSRNTEEQPAREPLPQIESNLDDYGNVIDRDYNSAFVSNGDSEEKDPDWSVTDSELSETEEYDQQISSEEAESSDYDPLQAPEKEPYLNSKFDVNRNWLNNNEEDWTPSAADMDQLEADAALSAQYEG